MFATAATAFSWDLFSYSLFRFLTGCGIGGEYSAVNSTIQEFIPARFRGRTDLAINGSFWIGGAIGACASLVFLDPLVVPAQYGWRAVFFVGSILSIAIIFLRTYIPESPRWLAIHGREKEAEAVMGDIETDVRKHGGTVPSPDTLKPMTIHARDHTPLGVVFKTIFVKHRNRAIVGLALMSAQAFFYNAIFFTFAQVLDRYYNVEVKNTGWYMLPFAIGNAIGPLLLGPLFDKVGRKPMIAGTYAISGVLLVISGWLFAAGLLILIAGLRERGREELVSRSAYERAASRSGENVTFAQAGWMGAVQGLALPFRGFSRSGSTISTGLLTGANRERAERFSFALAVILTPAVIGREALRLVKASHEAAATGVPANLHDSIAYSLIGMALSFFAGLAALRWLSSWLENGRWWLFGVYCILASGVVLFLHLHPELFMHPGTL